MSDIKLIRAKDIAQKYSIGLSTVWKYSGNGTLPPPYAKLSKKCTMWNADEVDQAIQKLHDNPNSDNDIVNFRAERSEDHTSLEVS
ncbi:MAG: AlpA family phage regulatory protein [Pelagibacterales bacterium]|nr:AlpA family phage regulatory protein [Pelagibacterales bacterium]